MTFETLGVPSALVERLAALNITTPTPIQAQAIPLAMQGRDVMGLAQTGTGKTLAFGLPLAQRLLTGNTPCQPKSIQALILAPTRELAGQIHDSLVSVTEGAHLRLMIVTGGVSINRQAQRLLKGVHVMIATPGRLIDLLDRGDARLNETRYLVLDEADQMLDLGFIHALRRIASLLPRERQTMLFSATMPKQMNELAQKYLTDPVRVEVNPPGRTADKIDQSIRFVGQTEKPGHLIGLLEDHAAELALVFTRTKHGADRLAKAIERAGITVAAIHGNKSQNQRERALKAFREGTLKVLVATDVAARGIDIPDVRHVYNYDLPNVPDTYVHRIGRTARAGRDGRAITLCSEAELEELAAIEKLIGQEIETHFGTRPANMRARPGAKPTQGRGQGRPQGQGRSHGQHGQGAKPAHPKPARAAQPAARAGEEGTAKPRRPRRRRKTSVAA